MNATGWVSRGLLIWLGLVGVLAVAGWGVWSNERILQNGRVVRLELAPVDPRSLMQGDYMILGYALADELRRSGPREDGFVVVRLDERHVAKLVRTIPRLDGAGAAVAAEEVALRYRVRQHRVQVATNAFFFQEGHEPVFREARFGEFRVGANGEPRLVALLDAQLKPLGENRF